MKRIKLGSGSSLSLFLVFLTVASVDAAIAPIFGEMPYFMSEEFGLVDCYMAPLLWRLPSLGIDFTGRGAKELKAYMVRLFERESFQASLTEAEREIRAGV